MEAKLKLTANQNIVFIGDSITATGREEPAYRPFGFGYVNFVANMLLAKFPQLNLNIVNAGINGNSVRSLQSRWQEDCLSFKPDILSIMVGVNDIWYQRDQERLDEAVYLDEYEATYTQLLSAAKEQCDCQLVLMQPFLLCSDQENQMLKDLRNHIAIVDKLADKFGAVLVPLQKRVDETIKSVPQERWSDDLVHPFIWAHAWIAQQWFEFTEL